MPKVQLNLLQSIQVHTTSSFQSQIYFVTGQNNSMRQFIHIAIPVPWKPKNITKSYTKPSETARKLLNKKENDTRNLTGQVRITSYRRESWGKCLKIRVWEVLGRIEPHSKDKTRKKSFEAILPNPPIPITPSNPLSLFLCLGLAGENCDEKVDGWEWYLWKNRLAQEDVLWRQLWKNMPSWKLRKACGQVRKLEKEKEVG